MWYVYQLSMFYPPENLLALYITDDLNCEHSFIRTLVKNQIGRVFVVVAFENKNKTLFLLITQLLTSVKGCLLLAEF